jgi:hypothetical protein
MRAAFLKKVFFYRLFVFILCHGLSLDASTSSPNVGDIPNGVANQSARFNSDCRSFDFFATLLVWTAREVGADCWAEVITTDGSSSSNTLEPVIFGWDPGFKVGLGYGMERDQWDTQAYFTWFHTQGNDSISSRPGAIHSTFMANFWVSNSDGAGLSGPSYQQASIDWTIKFNMFDWELGRNFWVSNSLALRPFLAAKGGWIHQCIHTTWQNPAFGNLPSPVPFSIGTENIKNYFWGIGPAAGMNMKWNLLTIPCHSFHLFGDFSGALMWGHWSFGDVFNNDSQEQVMVNVQSVNSGATMVRSFMGFGWDANLNQDRYRFSAKLGYETQFWLDQLQFYSFIGATLDTALTLQGGTFELSFDF